MKIFWSWQSDHDGRISHYLVRDALHAAIAKLRVPEDIEEPSEAKRPANSNSTTIRKAKPGGPISRPRFFGRCVYDPCPTCHGARFNPKTLEIKIRDKSVADVSA
jgi:hypothetical protein